eukprot:42612-Prymnesium_polylepis.1
MLEFPSRPRLSRGTNTRKPERAAERKQTRRWQRKGTCTAGNRKAKGDATQRATAGETLG